MALQESGEMYLETILRLQSGKKVVRSVDVADEMGYSKASVSRAIKILKDDGYLNTREVGNLVLTQQGESIAKKIYDRHKTLTEFFLQIGVDKKTAEEDACRVEHVISDTSFDAIKKMVKQKA